jgi:hypothetical protein
MEMVVAALVILIGSLLIVYFERRQRMKAKPAH